MIVVLEGTCIKEMDNHAKLIAQDIPYRKLYTIQQKLDLELAMLTSSEQGTIISPSSLAQSDIRCKNI
jgi:hypothetical protein